MCLIRPIGKPMSLRLGDEWHPLLCAVDHAHHSVFSCFTILSHATIACKWKTLITAVYFLLPQTHLCTTFILELLNALFGQLLVESTKFISALFLFLVVWQMFISARPNVHFVYNKYKVLLLASSVQSNILRSVCIPIEISGQGYNVIFLWTWHYGED